MTHLNNYICNYVDYKILDFEPDAMIAYVFRASLGKLTIICMRGMNLGGHGAEHDKLGFEIVPLHVSHAPCNVTL